MRVIQNNDLNLKNEKVSVLYFSAAWCGPCKILKPVMEEISKEMSDNIDINYIDINDNMELCAKYGIMSVPTLLFIKEGENKNKIVGLQPKTNIIHAINNIQ
jgi:thioredoxin 1